MPATIQDLWGDDIRVDVLTPLAILRSQAELLSRRTQGILKAEVQTSTVENQQQHKFLLEAPSVNYYSELLLTATHDKKKVYPVTVTSSALVPSGNRPLQILLPSADYREDQKVAPTDEEFMSLLSQIFRSVSVRSLIQSLIAMSNEATLTNGSDESTPPST